MATTAQGSLSLAVENLRTLIKDTGAFQTWLAEGGTQFSPAEALNRVYRDAAPMTDRGGEAHPLEEIQQYRPYAMIWSVAYKLQKYAEGGRRESGILGMKLVQDVEEYISTDVQEVGYRFENQIGLIVDGMSALSFSGPYLIINEIAMSSPTMRSAKADLHTLGDVIWVDFRITWGTEGFS